MSEYNGWSNYETWNAYLWLGNDEGHYNDILDLSRQTDFAPLLEDYCYNIWGDQTPDDAKLSEVNWDELAEAFRE